MKKKAMAMLLTTAMAVSALAGCGSSSADTGSTAAGSAESGDADGGEAAEGEGGDFSNIDTSEEVNLVISVFGGTNVADLDQINEKISEITKEKLNCTVEIQGMSNYVQQYPIVLSTNEPIDLIWTATWNNCWDYSKQGAFQDITDLVNEKFPDLKDLIGEDKWDACAVDGSYYIIPSANDASPSNWAQWGVVWREDLRKELGCEPITSIETMEAYAEAVLKSGNGMIPFCDTGAGGLWHTMLEKEHIYTEFGSPFNTLALDLDTDEIVDYATLDGVQEMCETQRKWEKNGYIQPDVASSTDSGSDGMLSGKYAGYLCSTISTYESQFAAPIAAAHPDWELGYMNYGEMFQYAYPNSPAMGSLAIPAASENPERALAFLELLLTDNELYNLIDCGIQGVHYDVDEDGYYTSLQGDAITYPRESLWLTSYYVNEDAKIYTEGDVAGMTYIEEKLAPIAVECYWQNFPYDASGYSEYATACSTVYSEYWSPLLTGQLDDVTGGLATLDQKMLENGQDKILEALTPQWEAYKKQIGR